MSIRLKFPFLFSMLIMLCSCTPESELNNWLQQYGIDSEYFTRKEKGELASLWNKEYKLELWIDTLNNWYYSQDSSYALLSNFNASGDYAYELSDGSITTDFYDSRTDKFYRNFSFRETESIKMIDIHWVSDSVVYFLSKDKQSRSFSLLEITMFNDSATQYSN